MIFKEKTMETQHSIPDGIYYIVLADLVSSTKFAAKFGNDLLKNRIGAFVEAALLALKHAKMTQNSGRFFKPVGDAVLLVFSHFPDVVQWTMEFEGALGLASIYHDLPLKARICVHAGEIRIEKDDAVAFAINQLFKMEKNVRTKNVVITEIAHQLALPSLVPKQCSFRRYSLISLPGHPRPVRLHRLIISAGLALLYDKQHRAKLRVEEAKAVIKGEQIDGRGIGET